MTQFARPLAVAFLVTMLQPQGVFAQAFSPEELWGHWQEEVALVGGQLSADVSREGNQLILNNIVLQSDVDAPSDTPPNQPSNAEVVGFKLEQAILTRRADGAVEVKFPQTFAMVFGDLEDGQQMHFDVASPDLAIAVMGFGDSADVTMKAATISVTLDELVGFENVPKNAVNMNLDLAAVDLRYVHNIAEKSFSLDTAGSIGLLNAELILDEPSMPQPAKVELDLANSGWAVQAGFPEAAYDFAAASEGDKLNTLGGAIGLLDAGAFFNLDFGLGVSGLRWQGVPGVGRPALTPGMADHFEFVLGGAQGKTRLDKTGFSHSTDLLGLGLVLPKAMFGQTTVESGDYSITLDNYAQSLSVGLNDLSKEQAWSYVFKLRDLQWSQDLWAFMDPSKLLPRDKTSVAVSLSGKYLLNQAALWVPNAIETMPIFSTFSLNLSELMGNALGASVTAGGALVFDMNNAPVIEGIPMPEGELHATLTGVYALIDKLLAANYITADDALGARAGLMMIGKLGDKADVLNSEMLFKNGAFTLNGVAID